MAHVIISTTRIGFIRYEGLGFSVVCHSKLTCFGSHKLQNLHHFIEWKRPESLLLFGQSEYT